MNAGLITSYIIAGILIVAIITMNNSVSNSASDITMSQITREKMKSITEIISGDIQKIGYNRAGETSTKIDVADSSSIQFYSNIDNSTENSVELVTWKLTDDPVSSTANPNDYILERTVDGQTTQIKLGITDFKIAYYDEYGANIGDSLSTPVSPSKRDEIKQLYIRIKIESPEKIYQGVNSEGHYKPSVWEKRFSPPNLESTN